MGIFGRKDDITLGHKYRDRITGWTGVAVSDHNYLYGCKRVTLTACTKDGEPTECTFDAPQLEHVDGPVIEPDLVHMAKTGGDRPTPPRRGS